MPQRHSTASRRLLLHRSRWLRLLSIVGPGLIAANAGNDAGGIATYATIGASYGYQMCWVIVLITFCLFVVQEMCARMGAVTGKGLTDLIRENFGLRWTLFAMACILIANAGTVISEFVGIAAALDLFGISKFVSVPVFALIVWWTVVRASYKKVERVLLVLTLPFFAYVLAAFLSRPDWGSVARHMFVPSIHRDSAYVMLLVATVGTTITPYMQLILQSTIVEKGVDAKHYRSEWWDTLVGTLFGNAISLLIVIATAATLHRAGITVDSAEDAARALTPVAGRYATVLFGVGLFGASMLAAAVLPLSTAFSISEALGWKSGVRYEFRDAPQFYTLFSALILFGAAVTLIPGLPLIRVLLVVQTVNGVLLPVLLVFITRLAQNERLLGEFRSKGVSLWSAWATTAFVGVLVMWLLYLTVVRPLFGR